MKQTLAIISFLLCAITMNAEEENLTIQEGKTENNYLGAIYTDDATDNGIVSIADDRALAIKSKSGKFVFTPYLLIQTQGNFNWYDDEGLDKAYNQDNVANSGFSVPYAILGFMGKAFGRVSYNLSINASATGAQVLQQAWFDVKFKDAFQIKAGKFKTPFSHGFQTVLGETLMPQLPYSLTSSVIMPYSLNAVTPSMNSGWDLGIEVHGQNKKHTLGYEVGVFNGTGAGLNTATKTISDDWHIPSLLYAGRISVTPKGTMPRTNGRPNFRDFKYEMAVSGSMNVESEYESTNDGRLGVEFSLIKNRWYLGAEAYWMNVGFTKRQKISEHYNYIGGYAQLGYFASKKVQLAARYDMFSRNGTEKDGFLNSPAVGVNYFMGWGLKLSGMYQYTGRWGHATQLDRDNDDLGIATHSATLTLQYAF